MEYKHAVLCYERFSCSSITRGSWSHHRSTPPSRHSVSNSNLQKLILIFAAGFLSPSGSSAVQLQKDLQPVPLQLSCAGHSLHPALRLRQHQRRHPTHRLRLYAPQLQHYRPGPRPHPDQHLRPERQHHARGPALTAGLATVRTNACAVTTAATATRTTATASLPRSLRRPLRPDTCIPHRLNALLRRTSLP